MAALYEAYMLCGLLPPPNCTNSGIQGLEPDSDPDRVIVTDCSRSVTVYKVSDQKPLGSWTVRQGQSVSCPAVRNTQTGEYVVVTDEKTVRVWKDEDVTFERAFKATVSAEVFRVHSVPEGEPVVLFRRGAVRLLDSLLAAPQQPVEDVLSEDEVIRWSEAVWAEQQAVLLFSTEQRGEHFLYVQRFGPNSVTKHRLEAGPLSHAATYRDGALHLLCLHSCGGVYESVLAVRPGGSGVPDGVQGLPRSLVLKLPAGDGELSCAAILPLDRAHIAVVGVMHPSAGAGKDYLCVWNTRFQTLQAARELPGKIYGQLWCYSGRLFVPHGKTLSVIPFECHESSLAAAVGKLKQTSSDESRHPSAVPSWNVLLHGEAPQTQGKGRGAAASKSRQSSKKPSGPAAEQLAETIRVGSVEEVQREVELFLRGSEQEVLQVAAGRLACEIVTRCQAEPGFYPQAALYQLVDTHYLCHSVCPQLLMLALEKNDFRLSQLCLQLFPDVPEAVTCTCLKTILSASDSDLERADLESDGLLFMKALAQTPDQAEPEPNGFCPPPAEESCDAMPETPAGGDLLDLDMSCPVGVHRGALINEILQTPYTDNLLLPHLKDLSVPQVILLLQYLRFLYLKYSHDAHAQIRALRMPAITQIMDWVCLLLDAHFTVLVLAPDAKDLLSSLHKFVRSQVKLYSELGKIEGSLQVLQKTTQTKETGQYSIEVVKLY